MRAAHAFRCLWTIAMLAVAGCGGGLGGGVAATVPSATPHATVVNTCGQAHQSKHLAYLVVRHLSGQTVERCAGFDGDAIDGASVMRATGIQYQSAGTGMCQVDHEPQQFNDCSADQVHWILWVYRGGAWSQPSGLYTNVQLRGGDALGWTCALPGVTSPPPPPTPAPL